MRKTILFTMMLSLLLIFSSCLQHLFKITILEDGSVEYFYKVSGDSSDLYDETSDLPPEAEWTIQQFTELDTTDDGVDTVYVLTAERTFAADELQFSDNFSGRAELLQHPLKIKKNDLFFIVNYNFDFSFNDRETNRLYGSEEDYLPEDITSEEDEPNDSIKAIYEAQIKEGYLNWGVDFYLNRFILATQKSRGSEGMVSDSILMRDLKTELKAYLFNELPKFDLETEFDDDSIWPNIAEDGYEVIATVIGTDIQSDFMNSVRMNAEFYRTSYSATNDLQDESFRIELRMPGIIKSFNADTLEDDLLIWEFDSEAFMDSTIYLSAVSIEYRYQYIYPFAAIVVIVIIIILGRIITNRKK